MRRLLAPLSLAALLVAAADSAAAESGTLAVSRGPTIASVSADGTRLRRLGVAGTDPSWRR